MPSNKDVINEAEGFLLSSSPEPHATRRKSMLTKDYAPKIRKLMTSDWTVAWRITSLVAVQLVLAWVMRSASLLRVCIVGYCLGSTCTMALLIAMHECSHNLVFGQNYRTFNKMMAIFSSLTTGFPLAITFSKYHIRHHRNLGSLKWDDDFPTDVEARIFQGRLGKLAWLFLLPFVLPMRTFIVNRSESPKFYEYVNFAVQFAFDAAVVYFMSWTSLIYLTASFLLGFGIHPMSGRIISEHVVFVKGYETFSYYGPLNVLACNLGYHNEHHDFPNVPGRYLPDLKRVALEFYDQLPCHYSWSKVIWDFVTDGNISLYSRVRRKTAHQVITEDFLEINRQLKKIANPVLCIS